MKAVTLIAVIIVLVTAWTVTVAAPRALWQPPKPGQAQHDFSAIAEASKAREFIRATNPALSAGEVDKLLAAFLRASREHRIPLDLLLSVAAAESHFRATVVSRKGCIGIMQVKPSTARGFGIDPAELTDPAVNIDAGARYLKILLDRYEDTELAVSAYNAGPGRVKDRVPSITETRQYVARVVANREVLRGGMGDSQGGIDMYQVGEHVEIELKSWIAKKLGSDTRFVEGVVKATTNKAVLIATVDGDEVWIPYAGIEWQSVG